MSNVVFTSQNNGFLYRADQIVLLRLSVAHGDPDHKLAGRRSFFRRSKKGSHSYSVSHSRESSDTSVSTFTGKLAELKFEKQ